MRPCAPRLLLALVMFASLRGADAQAATFTAASPWNTAVPAAATFAAAPAASGLVAGVDSWDPQGTWAIASTAAASTDALRPLLYHPLAWYKVFSGEWKRTGNSAAVEAEIRSGAKTSFPYPGNVFSTTSKAGWALPASYNKTVNPSSPPARFRIGAGAAPAPGADGHLAATQPDGTVLETYATILLSTGEIVALSYAVTSPTSLGDGWQNGQTASMLPSYAGLFCDADLAAGLKHAMAISVPPSLLSPQVAYPAYAFDRDAMTNQQPYSGALPMGARLALPPSVSVASLNLSTAEGKAVAAAARTYGFIIVDRGGSGVTIRVTPSCPTKSAALRAWNWGLQSDLNAIFAKVRRVAW